MGFDLVPQHFDANLNDVLILNITAKSLEHQSGYPRGQDAIGAGGTRATWRMMAPNEVSSNLVHEWSEYESIATRIAQLSGELQKGVSAGKQLYSGAKEGAEMIKSGGGSVKFTEAVRSAGNQELTSMLNFRVDSALVYRNTQRREYTLNLELKTCDSKTNEGTLNAAVRKFEELSCPEAKGGHIKIEWPSIFRVETTPYPLIFIEYAALTAVQPVYKWPYVGGMSRNIELQLTFMDIKPVYASTYQRGNSPVRTG